MYYRLHEHCKLVTGKARGAIYDLHSGKVYSINSAAAHLLEDCARGQSSCNTVEYTAAQIQFFDTLTKKGLGGLYFVAPTEDNGKTRQKDSVSLNFAWLELTSCCNNRCLHCYTASTGKETDEKTVSLDRWLSLLDEIRVTGCDAIQFIGGEPLLYPSWRTLVKKARELNFNFIEIFTNATLIDDDIIDFFSENKIHIATTIYADHATVHDAVTQNKGSFEKTLHSIKKMLAKRIPLRIASILMKANENEADRIIAFCEGLGVEANPPDVIRPTGRGDDTGLLPASYQRPRVQPPFYVMETEFHLAQTAHPCLAGKIAITTGGDVFPCIFARDTSMGNVLNSPLSSILKSTKLTDCWLTTKDKIKKCLDCEYRYACHDCRPLAQAADPDHDWFAAPSDCDYNPNKGIWEKTNTEKLSSE